MANLAGTGFGRVLRTAAPSLTRRFFSCHARDLHFNSLLSQQPSPKCPALRDVRVLRSCRNATSPSVPSVLLRQTIRAFSQTARTKQEIVTGQRATKKSSFPDSSSNAVAYWLLASAASVFGIVVFGGLTRLTESGLSITEWRPVTGSLPPMSEADWNSEFTKYKSSPEFHLLNSRMTLEEFKSIYWMEWIHRLWGRAVGITFILPAAFFILRKRVSKPMTLRLAGIGSLIGFQGFIGWWMVKSGLKDDLFAPGSHPRVSQYRLAAHLGTAFVCYVAMVWNGLNILRTNKLLSLPTEAATSQLYSLRNPALRPFKISIAVLAGLVFTTALSGALVAGLDAGLIYNEFPYMGLGLAPPKSELFDSFYSRKEDRSDLWWRNVLENPSLVQLDHRILATTTFTAIMAVFAWSRLSPTLINYLPRSAKKGLHGVVGFAWLQVILGISTLIYLVPIPLASAHQAGALALLTWTTVLGSRIWYPKAAARILQQRMTAAVNGQTSRSATGAAVYEFPAVQKVKPNLGAEGPVVQAGASALFAGLSSLVVANAGSESSLVKDVPLSGVDARLEFLRKQSAICGPRDMRVVV